MTSLHIPFIDSWVDARLKVFGEALAARISADQSTRLDNVAQVLAAAMADTASRSVELWQTLAKELLEGQADAILESLGVRTAPTSTVSRELGLHRGNGDGEGRAE